MNRIQGVKQAMEIKVFDTNTKIGVYREQINYYSNSVTKYIEGGYESDTEIIKLDKWWERRKFVIEKQIFFKKDYSTKPWIFFTANKLKNFSVKKNKDSNKNNSSNSLIIDVIKKKVMTSYFTVEVHVTANENVREEEIDYDSNPFIVIQYIALNKF